MSEWRDAFFQAASRLCVGVSYHDRRGNPITMGQWAQRLEGEKRVAEDTLPNGRWVSTVWLGLNHAHGDGPPLIFETMVFDGKDTMHEEYCERYNTEAEAIAGHARVVKKWMTEASPSTDE